MFACSSAVRRVFAGLLLAFTVTGCPIPERRPPAPLPTPDDDPETPPFGVTIIARTPH